MLTTRSFALAAIVAASAACTTHVAALPANALTVVPGGAGNLTASGGYLYWARAEVDGTKPETWSIERISEGGGSVERLAENVPWPLPSGLAVDGTNVYWTDSYGGRLLAVPASGAPSGAAPTVIASNLTSPSGVVVAGGAAYVLNGILGSLDLVRVPLDGGAESTFQSQGLWSLLASDGTSVYFLRLVAAPGPLGLAVGVYAYDGSGAPREVLPPSQIIEEIALDGGNLYALVVDPTSDSLDDVVRVPLAGGAPVTLASGVQASHLAAASGSVYWSSGKGVWTVPGAGGTPSEFSKDDALEFASDGGRLYAVAVDDAGDTVIVDESR